MSYHLVYGYTLIISECCVAIEPKRMVLLSVRYIVKNGSIILALLPCKKWFHHSCIGTRESEFKPLHKAKNIYYICEYYRLKYEFVGRIHPNLKIEKEFCSTS